MKQITRYTLLLCTVLVQQAYSQIIINEVQFGNKTTLTDSDGETPDWIELYNKSNKPIKTEGHSINDSKNLEEAWIIPDVSIPAKGYLLIYASGKNIRTENDLHTDFKLSNLKDSLFLFNQAGNILDSVLPECVPDDKSLGYIENQSQRKLMTPTPGKANSSSFITDFHFEPDSLWVDKSSGKYNQSIEINFDKIEENNQIFYTLNGNDPDEESILYDGAISLNDLSDNENRFAQKVAEFKPGDYIAKANVIRAQVYSNGCPASNEISNTYFIGTKNTFKYNVPVISIITDKDNLFDEQEGIYVSGNNENYLQKGSDWERKAHIEYFDTSGIQVINQDAGIRIHGRSSRWLPQKSFRLYAKAAYGKETFQYPFFLQKPALNEFKTLLLRTTYGDWSKTMFKDELCHKIVDPMDMDYMAGQTNIVFVNGEYWGIYSLRERQDEHYVTNNHGIVKPDLDIISFDGGVHVKSGSIDNYQNLINWLNINNPKESQFYTKAAEKIDLDNVTDYFIAQLFLAHFDFPNLNVDMWRSRESTGKWRYLFFDLDAAMIKINYDHLSNYNNTIEDLQRFKYEEEFILSRLLENETFRDKFYLSFLNHLETTFSSQRILSLIDYYEKEYTPLIAEQSYRWAEPIDIHYWNYNLNVLKDFAVQRPAVVMEQLVKNFENPFSIFPNPAKDNFTISLVSDDSNIFHYSIIDSHGTCIIKETSMDYKTTINEQLKSGMYIVIIEIKGYQFHEKLFVL